MTINELKKRYFRRVLGHPKGVFTHAGDCSMYACYICNCGLFHYLKPFLSGMDDNLIRAIRRLLYKNYDIEEIRHDCMINEINYTGLHQKIWNKAEKYAKDHPFNEEDFKKALKDMGVNLAEDK